MSRNNFIPVALAVGAGVFAGYYTFQPALRDYAYKTNHPTSLQESQTEHQQQHMEQTDQNPTATPVTVADPSATPSERWTAKIWPFRKQTAQADMPDQARQIGSENQGQSGNRNN